MRETDLHKPILIFLGFVSSTYSRSAILLSHKSSKYVKEFYEAPTKSFSALRLVIRLKKIHKNRKVIFVIMSPCHKLTLPTRLIARKNVILDAGWPLSDGELSRSFRWQSFFSIPKTVLIDLIAFHSASLVLTETEKQKYRIARLFRVSHKRLFVSYTGFNESLVLKQTIDEVFLTKIRKQVETLDNKVVIIFRGKINNESGYSRIIQVAKILETQATFLLLVNQNPWTGLTPRNCIEINTFSDEQMFSCYRISQIALGQISNHNRLELTIPHKAFEAAYFGKTYLTNRSAGMEEFGNEEQLAFLNSLNPEKVAQQIIEISIPATVEFYGRNLKAQYNFRYSQEVLNRNFENVLDFFTRCR